MKASTYAFPCLAAFAAAASLIAAPASAADVRVVYGDLDLDTPAGAALLEARITSAARRMCLNRSRTDIGCMNAVREEARDLIAQRRGPSDADWVQAAELARADADAGREAGGTR